MEDSGEVDNKDSYDANEAAFITSRLVLRGVGSGDDDNDGSLDQLHSLNTMYAGDTEGEEGHLATDVLGASVADTMLFHGAEADVLGHFPTTDSGSNMAPHEEGHFDGAMASIYIVGKDEEGGDGDDGNDNWMDDTMDLNVFSQDETGADTAGGTADGGEDEKLAFAFSRVKELLKFHSGFTIVSKDAVLAAVDAVVLLLHDLTRLAAVRAEREGRKTVRYSDIANVVHYFDQFSFLVDIIPQAQVIKEQGLMRYMNSQLTNLQTDSQANFVGGKHRGRSQADGQPPIRKRQVKLSFGRLRETEMPGNLRPVSPYQEQNRPLDQMTDDELRREMVQLVRMNAQLAEESAGLQADIGALCEESVRFQQSTEIEEDKLTNQLLRRLQSEEVQKHRFHRQILREEEARRQIMDQIARVRQQKAELENQLVHEQEMQRMGLQKKLIDVVNKKIEMERRLLNERHAQLEALTTKLALIKECTLAAKTKSDVMCDDPKAVESTVASQSPTRGDTAVGGPVVPHVAGASTPQRAAGTSATGSTPPTLLSDNGGDDVDAAITRLEEQLSRLLEQHAIATQTNASNETLYTELGRNLESIQQAASIDKAHTLKLRNELMEAKKRVALLEQRAAAGAVYAASDDSSDMQTPSVSSI